jgi:hypothetical protein
VLYNLGNGILVLNGAGRPTAPYSSGGTITQTLTGDHNIVRGNSGDGVKLANRATYSGSVVSQTAVLSNNTIAFNGTDGIALPNDAILGGLISQNVTIDPSIIVFNSGNGIYGANFIQSATLSQTVAVLDNTISYNLGDGVRLLTTSAVAASIVTDLTVNNNRILGNLGNGVLVSADVQAGSTLDQTVTVFGNNIWSAGGVGVGVLATAVSGSTVNQTVHVGEDGIINLGRQGILVSAGGISASNILQSVDVYDNGVQSNGAGFNGIEVRGTADLSSALSQSALVRSNAVFDFGGTAIYVVGAATSSFTGFTQSVGVWNNLILSGPGNGIFVGTRLSDASAGVTGSAAVAIDDNRMRRVGSHGILADTQVTSAALVEDSFSVNRNRITYTGLSGGDAIHVSNEIGTSGTATQIGTIDDNTIAYNFGNGILLHNGVTGPGATLTQALTIDPNTILSNGLNGIYARNDVSQATLSQSLGILGNSIAGNGSDGIRIVTPDALSATISQDLQIDDNTIEDNLSNGVFVSLSTVSASDVNLTVEAARNVISNSVVRDGFGFLVAATLPDGGTLAQSVNLYRNGLYRFASNGITVESQVSGSGGLLQTVSLRGNRITSVGGTGILVSALDVSGTTFNQLAITNNTVSKAGGDGILISAAQVSGSDFVQLAQIAGNEVSSVGGNGIEIDTSLTAVSEGIPFVFVFATENNVSSAGGKGIVDRTFLSNATLLDLSIFGDNRVDAVSGIGIYIHNVAVGSAAVLQQVLLIVKNNVSQVSGGIASATGIDVVTSLQSGASGFLQSVIYGNTVTNVQAPGAVDAVAGIAVRNLVGDSYAPATLMQVLSILDNSVTHIGDQTSGHAVFGVGVAVRNSAGLLSTITQSAAVTSNTVSGVYGSGEAFGIYNVNRAGESGATIDQTIGINDNTVSSVNGFSFVEGIRNFNKVASGAVINQSLTIDPNTIGAISGDGLVVGIFDDSWVQSHGTLNQTAVFLSNQVSGVTADAVAAGIVKVTTIDYGGLASQSITVQGNQVSSIAADLGGAAAGIMVATYAEGNGLSSASAVQALDMIGNTVTGIDGHGPSVAGLRVVNRAEYGTISQILTLTSNTATNAHGDGIHVLNLASGEDGFISQAVDIGDNRATGNDYHGINLQAIAVTGGMVSQVGTMSGNVANSNGLGINVLVEAQGAGSVAYQSLAVTNNTVRNNKAAGIRFTVGAGFSARGNWTMTSNTATGNVIGEEFLVNGANASQTVNMTSGNVVSGNTVFTFGFIDHDGTQIIDKHTANNTSDGTDLVASTGLFVNQIINP